MNKLQLYLSIGVLSILSSYAQNPNANDIKLRSMLEIHEGKRSLSYDDRGHRAVGIGHQIPGYNDPELKAVGANVKRVYEGKERLSENQIQKLFEMDLKQARDVAVRFIGEKEFNALPDDIQNVLVDMAFNLNLNLLQFKDFRSSLIKRDYRKAAEDMKDSLWYPQVKSRGVDLYNIVNSFSNQDSIN